MLAPVVLFVYKRASLTRQVLEALAQNELADDTVLYIFCDGPRSNEQQSSLDKINETRSVIREKKWCGTVNIIERNENYGLAKSIIEGVTQIVNEYGKIIVLEDDIRPTPFFLRYMNDALDVYQSEQKVLSIGACNFYAKGKDIPETFFIKIPDCWGWATWSDRWKLFETDGVMLHRQLKERGLLDDFNLSGNYNFEQMLLDQVAGKNNSWAIRWQAVAYLTGKLSLYSRLAVVKNLGFGNDATHGGSGEVFGNTLIADRPINVSGIEVKTDRSVEDQMLNTYSRTRVSPLRSFLFRLKSRLTGSMK